MPLLRRDTPFISSTLAVHCPKSLPFSALAFVHTFFPPPLPPQLFRIGPGLVASLWGVFVFGEIKGQKNYVLLTVAFALIATAAILIALSA